MAHDQLSTFIRRLRRTVGPDDQSALGDGHLLERYVKDHDAAAFEVLVWRHGPMVLNVCRRLLNCHADVEDAFQAAFLILAQKASAIGKREALAGWLYKVAYRAALRARELRAWRREQPGVEELQAVSNADNPWSDLRPMLDEEISRLPDRFRHALVLCDLEGMSMEEAAAQLHCPRGTVSSRLVRARQRLRQRLERRGMVLSLAALMSALADSARSATLSAVWVDPVVKAAVATAAGSATTLSIGVVALSEGVLRTMFLHKLQTILSVGLLVGVLGIGAAAVGYQAWAAAGADSEGLPVAQTATAERADDKDKAEKKEPPQDDIFTSMRIQAAKTRSQNNLRQLAIAVHNYNDVYGSLPTHAIYSKDGKPLLSWRVALLPYLEQAPLYQQFKLNEPWDSAHNKKLLAKMPATYAPVLNPAKDGENTYYQVVTGKGTVFEGARKLKFTDIADGTSNTILIVEGPKAVPWTKPEDVVYVADKPTRIGGTLFTDGCNAALADGSSIFIAKTADKDSLWRAIMRADGEVLDRDKLSK